MVNKYSDELKKEKELMVKGNPFSNKQNIKQELKKNNIKTPYHVEKEKSNSYFNLILDSDYESLELDIKGLRYVSYMRGGKEIVQLERRDNHYLSEEGAEDLLMELKGHLSTDIKLGFMSRVEFFQIQEIIRKTLIKYIRKNLERLGMDTETKQRKARPLIVMVLNRIRSVYSQSIEGKTHKSSHGDISLSGALDMDRDNKYKLEDRKN